MQQDEQGRLRVTRLSDMQFDAIGAHPTVCRWEILHLTLAGDWVDSCSYEERRICVSRVAEAAFTLANRGRRAVNDQNESDAVERPARMEPPMSPKVAKGPKQIRASDEHGRREPRLTTEGGGGDDQGQTAQEPIERAEVQKARDQPPDRRRDPPFRQTFERRDHQSLRQDAVDHRHAASDRPGRGERGVVRIHLRIPDHTPLYGTYMPMGLARQYTCVW